MSNPPFYLTPEQIIEEYEDLSYAITSGKDVSQQARQHQIVRKQIISALNLQKKVSEYITEIDEEDITANRMSFRRYLQEELQKMLEESKKD